MSVGSDARIVGDGSAPATLAAVLAMLIERARDVASCDGASVALVEGTRLRYVAAVGVVEGTDYSCAIDEPAAWTARTGRAWIVQDSLGAVDDFDRETAEAYGVRSWCNLPLIHDGQVFGLLAIVDARPGAFPPRIVAPLTRLAEMAASLVAAARALDERSTLLAETAAALKRERLVLEGLDEGIVHEHSDGTITFNARALQLLPLSEDELARRAGSRPTGIEILDETGAPIVGMRPTEKAFTTGQRGQCVVSIRRDGGPARWLAVTATPLTPDDDGRPTSVVTSYVDLTELRASRARADDAASLVRVAFDNADNAILLQDSRGDIRLVNQTLLKLFGVTQAEIVGPWDEARFTHPDDVRLGWNHWRELQAGERSVYRMEKRHLHADGSTRWCMCIVAAVPAPDGEDGVWTLTQITDLTEQRETQRRLFHHVFHDPVTGLANRSVLMDRLDLALAKTLRSHPSAAVLLAQIGWVADGGQRRDVERDDRVLRQVARRLGVVLGSNDTFSRVGPRAVAVLLEDLDPSDADGVARGVADQMHVAVRAPILVGDLEVRAKLSIGIALMQEGQQAAEVVREAEAASAAATGRRGVATEVADARLRSRVRARRDLESALHGAVARSEIITHFQPKIDLRDGRLAGFEALARWSRPGHDLLGPDAFLGLARDLGLVAGIGRAVLRTVAFQLRTWSERFPGLAESYGDRRPAIACAVNLGAGELSAGVVNDIAEAIDISGSPGLIAIEITESQALAGDAHVANVIADIRAMGVHVGLDDFGTSYATLTTLAELEFDFLKVDRSFTAGLGVSRAGTAAVTATVGLGRALGLQVIAEGIETLAQLDALRRMSVDVGQGFLFGAATSKRDAEPFLLKAAAGHPHVDLPPLS